MAKVRLQLAAMAERGLQTEEERSVFRELQVLRLRRGCKGARGAGGSGWWSERGGGGAAAGAAR